MKKPGWEIIAAIGVIIFTIIAGYLVTLHNIAGAVLVVFIGSYILISTEKVNRTAMSLLGVAIVGVILYIALEIEVLTGVDHGGVEFSVLIAHIDWTTIMFIIAMSIIVGVAAASGLFQFIGLKIAARSQGKHRKLFITFLVFVSGISLFFDTVSTMLIAAPLTIEICKALEID
ncbi:MAG: SLC13 family permease, partial [Candidatus Thorarchaeota archaeon]